MTKSRAVGLGHRKGPDDSLSLSQSARESVGPVGVLGKTRNQSVPLGLGPPSRATPLDVAEWGQFWGLSESAVRQLDAHVRMIARSGLSRSRRNLLLGYRTLAAWRKVGREPLSS